MSLVGSTVPIAVLYSTDCRICAVALDASLRGYAIANETALFFHYSNLSETSRYFPCAKF